MANWKNAILNLDILNSQGWIGGWCNTLLRRSDALNWILRLVNIYQRNLPDKVMTHFVDNVGKLSSSVQLLRATINLCYWYDKKRIESK